MDIQQLKLSAELVRDLLKACDVRIGHSQALDLVAALPGLRNWPEVLAFPDRVSACTVDAFSVARLAGRLCDKYGVDLLSPEVLLRVLISDERLRSVGTRAPVDFSTYLTVQEVCSAPTALQAHQRFAENLDVLKDWQIIYADQQDVGTVKLLNLQLGNSGLAATVFRGRSLWIMDAPFVASGSSAKVDLRGGSALFVDSNAASYVRAMAYQAEPQDRVIQNARLMNKLGSRLQNLNFYLYLWEAQRHWSPKTRARCKESVAAIHALSASGSPLSLEWGNRYRCAFREQAENFAEGLISEFEQDLDAGLAQGIAQQVAMMEAILVRAQIIQLSSKKSPQHKLALLVAFMHEELSTMMLRELVVCGDLFSKSENSRMAQKLNSLQNHPNPEALLRNCAWDMFIPRALDMLAASRPAHTEQLDFYLAELLTFDGDVCDILRATQLRAIALHRPSMRPMPFYDNDVAEWLGNRVGDKRMAELDEFFQPSASKQRSERRSVKAVQDVLQEDWSHLLHLLKRAA
ncbi:MAG: hypothetical protein HY836_09785 [Aquabacterium sp.]|uniref:hypothetical protein n=1 Tax=Aquabacterium sp. TaxID=1872578 RepID=UPI0025B813D0|nr:hypothetical protein [Aquabacterium sp.]MBI5925875.1 hypothetical protein [Aquabacterium sp.]